MVTIVTRYGTYTGYRYDVYSNRVILLSYDESFSHGNIGIVSFLFRDVISITVESN